MIKGSLSDISAIEYFAFDLLNFRACASWVFCHFHPKGAFCPKCKEAIESVKNKENFWQGKRVCCNCCGTFFTARTGTVLNSLKADVCEIYLFFFFVGLGLDDKTIAKLLRIHEDTVKKWRKRFGL